MLSWLRKHQDIITGLWVPLSSLAANLLVVAALVIAFLTFQQQQRDAAVAASMNYVDQFNSGAILDARNVVFRSWLPYNFDVTGAALPKSALDALVSRVLLADEEQDKTYRLRTSLVNIVAFYDSVAACIRSMVCNSVLLREHLGGYGHDFLCLYQSFIEDQVIHSQLAGFGSGLLSFTGANGCLTAEGLTSEMERITLPR
jgi:hypothetical protein